MDDFPNTSSSTSYPADYDLTLHPQQQQHNLVNGSNGVVVDGGGPGGGIGLGTLHHTNSNDSLLGIDLDSFAGYVFPLEASVERTTPTDELDIGSDVTPLLPRTTSALRHDAVFEDAAFSDVFSSYDQACVTADQAPQDAKTPPLDSQDPLLQFSPPASHHQLLDFTYRAAPVSMEAQLNGMFFNSYSEAPTSMPGEDASSLALQQSVTCYRRNLFSVVGSITLPRSLRYISTEHVEQIPIVSTEVTLSATESMEGAGVKLISVPFKSANVSQGVEEKGDKDPPAIPLDLMSGSEMDSGFVTFPVVWKRLQFRSSTANNGRRKELQQTYTCCVSLVASLSTGQRVSLCDMTTEPIVVRGRSPRAFAARKEAPTSGGMMSQTRPKAMMQRHSTSDAARFAANKSETDFNFDFPDLTISPDTWLHRHPLGPQAFLHQQQQQQQQQVQHGAMTAIPPDTFRMGPQGHEFAVAQSSPDMSRYPGMPVGVNVPAPITLSLTEEDVVKKASPGAGATREGPRKTARLGGGNNAGGRLPVSFAVNATHNDNADAEDPLYEYFPLALDDWQEPVDAVYRPHVVHHISLPAAPKDMSRTRSKRYFAVASPS